MEKYDYRGAMREDIKRYIDQEYTKDEIKEMLEYRETWEEILLNELWTNDQVTGNASGSYWFSTWKAEEALCHNFDLLGEAMEELSQNWKDVEKGPEWADVCIRCYLLGQSISAVLDELEEERREQ